MGGQALGIGQLMDAMAREAREAGADLRLGTSVESIEVPDGALSAVWVSRGRRADRIDTDQAVVALPAAAAARIRW